ncbi:MAG: primosomal protein N', partial [Anaerolineae bacterium]
MYAQVLVFLPIKSRTSPLFDYEIPSEMEGQVLPGMLVTVPFRTRRLPGVVMGRSATPSVPDVRPIYALLTEEPVLSPALLHLARWMARETLALLHECVKTLLPPGLRPKTEMLLKAQVSRVPGELPANAEALLRLLIGRGPLRRSQVRSALQGVNWQRAIPYLRSRKLIVTETIQHLPRMRPRTVRTAMLAAPQPAWDAKMAGLQRVDFYRTILTFLEQEDEPVEASVVYAETGAKYYHLKMLHERGLIAFGSEERIRDPLEDLIFTPIEAPDLLPDQQAVWKELEAQMVPHGEPNLEAKMPPPVLLLGVTGSGKTEIYLRATERVLEQERQALILVPEISLTPQTVRRFLVRFPGRVGVWHSGMSDGERYDTWRRVRDGEVSVLVGARSALFAPFPHLGLIVLDEEEDTSYKQGQRPYYHARETAEELARLTGAQLILGSATPSLEAYTRALEGRYRLLQMPRRVLSHRQRIADWQRYLKIPVSRYRQTPEAPEVCTISLPSVQIVDMRAELKAGNRSIFSRPLQEAVDRALAHDEQIILFLNRRGTATHVFCRDCGWVADCPKCDIPLTYHARADALLCHHCSHRQPMVRRCPECGSRRVRAFGLGTEGLE